MEHILPYVLEHGSDQLEACLGGDTDIVELASEVLGEQQALQLMKVTCAHLLPKNLHCCDTAANPL